MADAAGQSIVQFATSELVSFVEGDEGFTLIQL